jgi:adenylyltransferase/sulfurtransferase
MPDAGSGIYRKLEETLFSRSHLAGLSAMVVGAGALGNEVARHLGLLGLAHVTVVDPDHVEPSNLPRSFLFWSGDYVGRNKAWSLASAAATLFPATKWIARETEIADIGYKTIAGADLVFSCVDSDLARLEIGYIARQVGVMVADGGLGRDDHSYGRVSIFPAAVRSACYGCFLGPRKRRELLETWHSSLRSCTDPPEDPRSSASTPTMGAIIASIQVELGLRSLLEPAGDDQKSRSIDIRLHPLRSLTEFTTEVSVACPFHSFDRAALWPLPAAESTFGDLLAASSADAIVLDWPICLHARCMACGHEWSPKLRLARLRRRGYCPVCRSRSFLELDTLRTITADSEFARVSPEALGLPPDHLFHLQRRAIST